MEVKFEPIYNIDAYQIQRYQQNRYPLLFVDRITEAVPGEYAKGYKQFSYNEWFFPAHFEDEPNVPGFVQIEALTQVFLMSFLTMPEYRGKKTGFVAIKNARFRKKIIPGDTLETDARLESVRRGLAKGTAVGYVNNEIACTVELEIAVPDVMNKYAPNAGGGVHSRIGKRMVFHILLHYSRIRTEKVRFRRCIIMRNCGRCA